MCLQIKACNLILTDDPDECFVDDTEHGDEVAVLRLRNELSQDADVVEGAFGVGETHIAVEEVYRGESARRGSSSQHRLLWEGNRNAPTFLNGYTLFRFKRTAHQ